MGRIVIYIRSSTEQQSYDQQKRSIDYWLQQTNNVVDKVFQEKESGSKKHSERILLKAIDFCDPSDTIVVSEFSRLSRSMSDAATIVELCILKGINIVAIKENLHIRGDQPNDLTTKLLSIVFGLAAEIELTNIRSRTQSGLDCIKDRIKKDGFAIGKKSGRRFEKLGNPNMADIALKGCYASADIRRAKKVKNIDFKKTYQLASLLRKNGLSNDQIAEKLNETGYKTSRGFDFLGATVSRLLSDGKKLLQNN